MEDKKKRVERQAKYTKKSVVQFNIRLVKATDGDIIEKLDNVGNKQGYIKQLIRKDLKGGVQDD